MNRVQNYYTVATRTMAEAINVAARHEGFSWDTWRWSVEYEQVKTMARIAFRYAMIAQRVSTFNPPRFTVKVVKPARR